METESRLDKIYAQWWGSPLSNPSPTDFIREVRAEALRMTRNEDVAQEACIVILNGLETFCRTDATAPTRWVRRVVKRIRLDAYRTSSDHTREFDENTINTSDSHAYVDASHLPEFIRIVADRLLQGFTIAEIATQINTSSAALRNKLARFRKSPLRNTPRKALVVRRQD
jgi:DNA-directed RNA polymerase specialized sigma24 family protein